MPYGGSAKVVPRRRSSDRRVCELHLLARPDHEVTGLRADLGVLIDAFVIRMTVVPATMFVSVKPHGGCLGGSGDFSRTLTSKVVVSVSPPRLQRSTARNMDRVTPDDAERAAVRVGVLTTVIGGVLAAAPARVGPLMGLTDPRAARLVGLTDLALVPGLFAADPDGPGSPPVPR